MKGRFFIDPSAVKDGAVRLSREESHHAISVLRIRTGDAVELLDGSGNSFRGIVSGLKDKRLLVSVDKSVSSVRATGRSVVHQPIQITLAASVIKPESMEILIQKACELGAQRIVPIMTERSVVKLSKERWESKHERWRKIVLESCKQCGRTIPLEMMPVQSYKAFLESARSFDHILIPTLAVLGEPLSNHLKKVHSGTILAMVGPEGDFTPREVQWAIEAGAKPVTLGQWVLRSETAALYLLSVLQFFYQEC